MLSLVNVWTNDQCLGNHRYALSRALVIVSQ